MNGAPGQPGLITERNRAAYIASVWSQRTPIATMAILDYAAQLSTNDPPGQMIAQAEWPDACPASVQWFADIFPAASGVPRFYQGVNQVAAFPFTNAPADNIEDIACGAIFVRWYVENVTYFCVCDYGQGGIDLPLANRVEVYALVGLPSEVPSSQLFVHASIGFCASPVRRDRCSSPVLTYNPSEQDTPGLWGLGFSPPFARDYELLVNVPDVVEPPIIEEVELLFGAQRLQRELVPSVAAGTYSFLNQRTTIAAPSRALAIRTAADVELVKYRVSWSVGPC